MGHRQQPARRDFGGRSFFTWNGAKVGHSEGHMDRWKVGVYLRASL